MGDFVMPGILENIEKLATDLQKSINEIPKLLTDFQKGINEVQKLPTEIQKGINEIQQSAANFHNSILEIQLMVERSIKIALAILVAAVIFYLVREFLSWKLQVKIQKQHLEMLQKMTRLISLLEKNLKK
jgi:predicted PurR-regulated permease PerM